MNRKKQEISEIERLQLIVESVLYCQKVIKMGMPPSCYSKALREPVFFLWEKWGKGNKYDIAKYRSVKSIGVPRGKNLLVYDHSIPFSYIQEKLLKLENVNVNSIKEVLIENLCACVITKEEDSKLNSLKLGSKMPANWDGKDLLARYRIAEIKIEENFIL